MPHILRRFSGKITAFFLISLFYSVIVERFSVAAVCRLLSLLCTKNDFKKKVQKYTFFVCFPRNGLYARAVCVVYFVCTLGVLLCTLGVLRAEGDA